MVATPLNAQQSRDSALITVRGLVRDAATREPLAGTNVRATDGAAVSTNERGEFELALRVARRVSIHLRHLGYDSLSVAVATPSPASEPLVLELLRAAHALDNVAISSRATSWSPKVEGFEHRLARHNGGTFFTRDEIEQRRPLLV